MGIERIPAHDARDRQAIVDYLIETAGHVASGRVAVDPYGVVLILVGPEDVTFGARGVTYRHDYFRAIAAFQAGIK